jgi:hypothetical protein
MLRDFLGVIYAEDNLIRKPVSAEIHDVGKKEGHHNAPFPVRPPKSSADLMEFICPLLEVLTFLRWERRASSFLRRDGDALRVLAITPG